MQELEIKLLYRIFKKTPAPQYLSMKKTLLSESKDETWGIDETNDYYDTYDKDIYGREEQSRCGPTTHKPSKTKKDMGQRPTMAQR